MWLLLGWVQREEVLKSCCWVEAGGEEVPQPQASHGRFLAHLLLLLQGLLEEEGILSPGGLWVVR